MVTDIKLNLSYGEETFRNVTPCSESFNYAEYAKEQDLRFCQNRKDDTGKFGGIGFICYYNFDFSNPNSSSNPHFSERKTLEVCFYNNLPIFYKLTQRD